MNKYDDKYLKCPACKSERINDYHSDFRGNSISICNSCNVQFMNPVYSDEYLDDFYSHYIPSEYSKVLVDHQDFVVRDNFSAIDNVINSKGLMLDFGVGDGLHSRYAENEGWKVKGYDVDCKAMDNLKEKFGLDVYCGDFFSIPWEQSSYKLVYLNQVLEHLKSPVKYLEYFHRLLSDDGYLYISVPNIKSTSNKFKFTLEKMGLRKKNIGKYYDSDHHVFYYHPKSLEKLLALNGYQVVLVRNCAKPKGNKSKLKRLIHKHITERFFYSSTFLILAKKIVK